MTAKTVVVGDADSLIALLFKTDVHYTLATRISQELYEEDITIIYPNTAIVEAITTLHRKLSQPFVAAALSEQFQKDVFAVEYVTETVMKAASQIYNPRGSKRNTFFDAIVAATAKELNTDAIFSFDDWYKKLGFSLASDIYAE